MLLSNFPGCCGAGVLSQLDRAFLLERMIPGDSEPPPNDYYALLQTLKGKIVEAKALHWGLLTATTNPLQAEFTGLLVKCGFELRTKFNNPKSRNSECTLWALDLAKVNLAELDAITL